MTGEAPPAEIAYYYPEPYWLANEGGWIKSLLLFFDEVAILLPSYMKGRNLIADLPSQDQSKNAAFSAYLSLVRFSTKSRSPN